MTRRGNSKAPETKKAVSKKKEEAFSLTAEEESALMEKQKMYDKSGVGKVLTALEQMNAKLEVPKLVDVSIKTKFLFSLMKNLRVEGHRLLIFSMSKMMLDLLEHMLNDPSNAFTYLRIDGDTEISSREQICKDFNSDPSIFCCILTTKVGGFGLNLTGADRAVILDPDWNPANDNQAIDRCYRIG